jgi:hypothetical protein
MMLRVKPLRTGPHRKNPALFKTKQKNPNDLKVWLAVSFELPKTSNAHKEHVELRTTLL